MLFYLRSDLSNLQRNHSQQSGGMGERKLSLTSPIKNRNKLHDTLSKVATSFNKAANGKIRNQVTTKIRNEKSLSGKFENYMNDQKQFFKNLNDVTSERVQHAPSSIMG